MSRNAARRYRKIQFGCLAYVAVALGMTACSHNIEVRTIAAPDATFAGRSTFSFCRCHHHVEALGSPRTIQCS